jgi:hypothetical protein
MHYVMSAIRNDPLAQNGKTERGFWRNLVMQIAFTLSFSERPSVTCGHWPASGALLHKSYEGFIS